MPPPEVVANVTEALKAESPKKTAVIVDPTGQKSLKMDPTIHAESLRIAAELQQLETHVQYCKNANIDWMEVTESLLKYFCKGHLPKSGYYIYKDIKLCLKDTAEEIAKRERLDCHQILFPDEGYMKVR